MYFARLFEDTKKLCCVNSNCPRGDGVKRSFFICHGNKKALVELEFIGPFCFDMKIRQSSFDCVGVFYRHFKVGGQQSQ